MYQENSALRPYAAAVRTTASGTSRAAAWRTRLALCVQAKRNVPDSSSRASAGPPTNAPSRTGTASSRNGTVCAFSPDFSTEPCPLP